MKLTPFLAVALVVGCQTPKAEADRMNPRAAELVRVDTVVLRGDTTLVRCYDGFRAMSCVTIRSNATAR